MAEKKGAGGEPQTYDEQTGRYGSDGGKRGYDSRDDLNIVRNAAKAVQAGKRAEAERIYNSDGYGGEHIPSSAEEEHLREIGIDKVTNLTKQEWAMFYERIGKIKKEGHYVSKTKIGDIIIPIETNDTNVIVIASGTYEKPKVKYSVRCSSNEEMYNIIEVLEGQ